MADTIFAKIIRGEIPCNRARETDTVLAFHDINPQAPVHVLIIPKQPIEDANHLTPENAGVLADMFLMAKDLARELGIADSGYRLVFNCGPHAGMEVPHLHLHLLGGRQMTWPPG